jgi:hypothetical protein
MLLGLAGVLLLGGCVAVTLVRNGAASRRTGRSPPGDGTGPVDNQRFPMSQHPLD